MGDHRQEMAKYCEAMGFHHRITMPEDTQANGFAEAFMKMLFKLVHTAMVEKTDPKRAVQKYLMAYCSTPHRMTGKSTAELIIGKQINTKLPRILPKAQGRAEKKARQTHEEERQEQKAYADAKWGAKAKKMEVGDEVMLPNKTTTKPPWDNDPWTVTEVKGSQVTVQRGDKKQWRAKNLVKLVK